VSVGRFEPPELPLRSDGVSFVYSVQPPEGRFRVEAVDGTAALGEADGIMNVFLNRPAGSVTDSANGTEEYICSVAGRVDDHATLRRTVAWIDETVTVRMTPLS
jgi:hypothetical protein